MDEFIKMVTSQLGLGEEQTRAATGGLLGMIKDKVGDGLGTEILSKLPGADALINDAPAAQAEAAESGGGGGMLGGLMSAAGKMLGGNAGSALGIASMLSSSGIDLEKSGSFITMFTSFVKDKIGDDMWGKLAEYLPDLNPND